MPLARADGQGHVTLRPEDDEDMWHVYNLIAEVSLVPTTMSSRIKL
jgi:protein pelota